MDTQHILIIDDDQDYCRALLSSVLNSKFSFTLSQDLKTAIEILKTQPFDAVVIDLNMPMFDGFTGIQWIRSGIFFTDKQCANHKTLPILVLSSAPKSYAANKALAAGATAFLQKTCQPVEFIQHLTDCIASTEVDSTDAGQIQHAVIQDDVATSNSDETIAMLLHDLLSPVLTFEMYRDLLIQHMPSLLLAVKDQHLIDNADMLMMLPTELNRLTQQNRQKIDTAWKQLNMHQNKEQHAEFIENIVPYFSSLWTQFEAHHLPNFTTYLPTLLQHYQDFKIESPDENKISNDHWIHLSNLSSKCNELVSHVQTLLDNCKPNSAQPIDK